RNVAVLGPHPYLDTSAGSRMVTTRRAFGLDVQTPPCLTQNEHPHTRAGITGGSPSHSSSRAMLAQWHVPLISTSISGDKVRHLPALADFCEAGAKGGPRVGRTLDVTVLIGALRLCYFREAPHVTRPFPPFGDCLIRTSVTSEAPGELLHHQRSKLRVVRGAGCQ